VRFSPAIHLPDEKMKLAWTRLQHMTQLLILICTQYCEKESCRCAVSGKDRSSVGN